MESNLIWRKKHVDLSELWSYMNREVDGPGLSFPIPFFPPSLKSLMVSVDVKQHKEQVDLYGQFKRRH